MASLHRHRKAASMLLTTLIASLSIVVSTEANAGTAIEPSSGIAAVPRPDFRAPWPCGQVRDYYHHSTEVSNAIDFNIPGSADLGTSALASFSGTVISARYNGGYGNEVVVDHGGGWRTRTAHLSAFSVGVGQVVQRGQELGKVGSTGNSSGPHLHYEQIADGVRVRIIIDDVAMIYDGLTHRHTSNNCAQARTSDVNGDGKADIVGVIGTQLVYHRGDGAGNFHWAFQGGTGWQNLDPVDAGDVNGDGLADIVGVIGAELVYHRGDSTGNFHWTFQGGTGWQNLTKMCLADVNGDGLAHIVGVIGAELVYHRGDGMGNFHWTFQGGTGWQNLTKMSVADVNGDGLADIVGVIGAELVYHRGDGTGNFHWTFQGGAGAGWESLTQLMLS